MTMPISYKAHDLSKRNKDIVIKKAKEFAIEPKSEKINKPKFKHVITHNMWEIMALGDGDKEGSDYKYWSKEKLKDTIFYPGISIGFVENILGKVISKSLMKDKFK